MTADGVIELHPIGVGLLLAETGGVTNALGEAGLIFGGAARISPWLIGLQKEGSGGPVANDIGLVTLDQFRRADAFAGRLDGIPQRDPGQLSQRSQGVR